MKNKRIFALLMVVVMTVSALALTACGGNKTLEDFVNSDKDLKAQIDKTAKENNLEITVKENTLTYTYKYTTEFTDAQIKLMAPQLETALEGAKNTFKGLAADLENKTKVKGIKIAVVYKDKKGKDIYKTEFSSK